jgi:glycosyltransferase involved in cell wall biosynthesis
MLRKKILFILHLPPPVHGASMMGQYLMENKKVNETFDCRYINLTTSSKIDDISSFNQAKIFILMKLYWKVLRTVVGRRYDLCYLTINSHGAGFYKEMVIVFILKLFRYRFIYHFHNKGVSNCQNNWLLSSLYRYQFRNSRAIMMSPLLYPDISKYMPEENVHYCANGIPVIPGIDINELNKFKRNRDVTELLFLSNMMTEKGVFVLLQACSILKSQSAKVRTTFIGDWGDISEDDFRRFVSSNNLGHEVSYEGKKYGNEKNEYLKKTDIFIFPTLNDIFGLVNLEAMQFGLPIISTNEGAIPEIVRDNYNGFLVPRNDPEGLAAKITELVNDPELRQEMGRRGRRRFEESYTLGNFENNFVRALNEIALEFD